MDKKKILKASYKLIKKIGLENFSMRKLASELNCQPASIYYYYETKNDILNDLYLSLYLKYFDIRDNKYDSLEDYLFDLCIRVQKHHKEYLFFIRHMHSHFLSKETKKIINSYHEYSRDLVSSFVAGKMVSCPDFVIINGTIIELAFMNQSKFSEEEIKVLVNKIAIAIKGE